MRKADYETLAARIDTVRALAIERRAHPDRAPEGIEFDNGQINACESIANYFARFAHVDRAAFLKACGIES